MKAKIFTKILLTTFIYMINVSLHYNFLSIITIYAAKQDSKLARKKIEVETKF